MCVSPHSPLNSKASEPGIPHFRPAEGRRFSSKSPWNTVILSASTAECLTCDTLKGSEFYWVGAQHFLKISPLEGVLSRESKNWGTESHQSFLTIQAMSFFYKSNNVSYLFIFSSPPGPQVPAPNLSLHIFQSPDSN